MSDIDQAQIEQAIATYRDENLKTDYVTANAVQAIEIGADLIRVRLDLGYPAAGIKTEIEKALRQKIQPLAGDRQVEVVVGWEIKAQPIQADVPSLAGVKNIIAVASGKGGVGKSTTASNIALALSLEGAKVGILDADIYGPSQAVMLGIAPGRQPEVKDNKYWLPVAAHGVQAMSMAFLVGDDTPMVWRGPMVSGALQQLVNQTQWQDLDYLIVDMPPGTGDIQLTLAQKVPVTGALIVTTPQDIALIDARKGIEMFRQVEIPVLGVVENMSVHICSQCGHAEHLFGSGGGASIADDYDTELLGSLPLAMSIREQADGGKPTVVADPDGEVARIYRQVARRLAGLIASKSREDKGGFPTISIDND